MKASPSSKEARKQELKGSLRYIVIQRTGDVDQCKILLTLVMKAIPTVRVSLLSSCAYFNVSELSKQCCDLLGFGILTKCSLSSMCGIGNNDNTECWGPKHRSWQASWKLGGQVALVSTDAGLTELAILAQAKRSSIKTSRSLWANQMLCCQYLENLRHFRTRYPTFHFDTKMPKFCDWSQAEVPVTEMMWMGKAQGSGNLAA